MGTFTQYAIAAARQALEDAEWKPEDDIGKERTVSSSGCQCLYIILILSRVSALDQEWEALEISYQHPYPLIKQ